MRTQTILGLIAVAATTAFTGNVRAEDAAPTARVSPTYAPLAPSMRGVIKPELLDLAVADPTGAPIVRRANEPGSKRSGTNEHWSLETCAQGAVDPAKGLLFWALGTHPGSETAEREGGKRNTSADAYLLRLGPNGIEVLKYFSLNRFVEKFAGKDGNDLRFDGLLFGMKCLDMKAVDGGTEIVAAFMLDIRRNVTGDAANGTTKSMEVTNRTHVFAAPVVMTVPDAGEPAVRLPEVLDFVQVDVANNTANQGAYQWSYAVDPGVPGIAKAVPVMFYYDGGENQHAYFTWLGLKAGYTTADPSTLKLEVGPKTIASTGRVPIGRFSLGAMSGAPLGCWGEANNRPPREINCATFNYLPSTARPEDAIKFRLEGVLTGTGEKGKPFAGYNSPSIIGIDPSKLVGEDLSASTLRDTPWLYANATDMMGKNTNRKGLNTPVMLQFQRTIGEAFRVDRRGFEGADPMTNNWLATHVHASALGPDRVGFWGGAMASNTPGRLLTAELKPQALTFIRNIAFNPHTDMGYASMMLGENPGNQGRNFIFAPVVLKNPWYGGAAGFMTKAKRIAINAVTGTLPGLTDIKGLPQIVAVPLDVDPGVEIAAPVYPGTPATEPSSPPEASAGNTGPASAAGCGCTVTGYSDSGSTGNLALLGLAVGAAVAARRRRA